MAVILAITILGTGLIGSYTTVPAAEFSAGALAASETLEWITAALGAVGISISVKELLKPRQADIEKDIGKHIDWDNYDWGDALDSPAAQDQIDELDKTINRLYGNASAKWKEMYEKSLSPTPTPETSPDNPEPSPPVTVAPVDPDTVTPPDWETLKNMSKHNGFIPLEVGTFWCLKEAVKGFWDNLMEEDSKTNVVKNKYKDNTLLGYQSVTSVSATSNKETMTTYAYDINGNITKLQIGDSTKSGCSPYHNFSTIEKNTLIGSYYFFNRSWNSSPRSGTTSGTSVYNYSVYNTTNEEYHFYVPLVDSDGNVVKDAEVRPIGKTAIWPSTDLKNDYDNNKSPSIPETAPAPAIKIPSLDDLKDLQKRGNDASDDDRPSIILDWLKDHYTNPSTDPQPTTAPDPDPNPTTAPNPDPDPNPDPNPDPTTTPAVNPEPSTAPKPSGTPENPDDTDTDTDIDPDDYKTDLRLVFPFCIPFDLVHLIQAFEAEPEAPVFEFPLDLELENPWTGKKILDYHHVFKLDMSDYEPVIKIFRIFEIIFFIIGLLMITRQQMIKG